LLVQIAFDINDDQLIANAPKWFDSTKYSIIARTSAIAKPMRSGPRSLRCLLTRRIRLV